MNMKIKTIADVQAVPENQRISTMNYDDCTCVFCGMPLSWETVGWGRDKCRQYHSCSCEVAKAAEAHNKRADELKQEAWRKERERQEKAAARERKKAAKKPLTVTAEQMLCVATGRILPDCNPVEAEDAIAAAMRKAGFRKGSAQEKLNAYALKKGFAEALSAAAAELVKSKCRANIEVLCKKYSLPKVITF